MKKLGNSKLITVSMIIRWARSTRVSYRLKMEKEEKKNRKRTTNVQAYKKTWGGVRILSPLSHRSQHVLARGPTWLWELDRWESWILKSSNSERRRSKLWRLSGTRQPKRWLGRWKILWGSPTLIFLLVSLIFVDENFKRWG